MLRFWIEKNEYSLKKEKKRNLGSRLLRSHKSLNSFLIWIKHSILKRLIQL